MENPLVVRRDFLLRYDASEISDSITVNRTHIVGIYGNELTTVGFIIPRLIRGIHGNRERDRGMRIEVTLRVGVTLDG